MWWHVASRLINAAHVFSTRNLSIYLSIYRAKLQHEDGEVVRPANWRGPSAPVICAQVPFYRKVGRS